MLTVIRDFNNNSDIEAATIDMRHWVINFNQ